MLYCNYTVMKTLESYYIRKTETPHICIKNIAIATKKKKKGECWSGKTSKWS